MMLEKHGLPLNITQTLPRLAFPLDAEPIESSRYALFIFLCPVLLA